MKKLLFLLLAVLLVFSATNAFAGSCYSTAWSSTESWDHDYDTGYINGPTTATIDFNFFVGNDGIGTGDATVNGMTYVEAWYYFDAFPAERYREYAYGFCSTNAWAWGGGDADYTRTDVIISW